jgi:hypothetical protein
MPRTITLESDGLEVVIHESMPEDETLEGWRPLIEQALLGLGYHPDSVKDFFGEDL